MSFKSVPATTYRKSLINVSLIHQWWKTHTGMRTDWLVLHRSQLSQKTTTSSRNASRNYFFPFFKKKKNLLKISFSWHDHAYADWLSYQGWVLRVHNYVCCCDNRDYLSVAARTNTPIFLLWHLAKSWQRKNFSRHKNETRKAHSIERRRAADAVFARWPGKAKLTTGGQADSHKNQRCLWSQRIMGVRGPPVNSDLCGWLRCKLKLFCKTLLKDLSCVTGVTRWRTRSGGFFSFLFFSCRN